MNSDKAKCPLVSVVSLTYDRRDKLTDLLLALREQTYSPIEVIVVDNASTDGTASMIEVEFPEVRLVRTSENIGSPAYRYGLEKASGEFVLLIDDDGLPDRHWVSDIVARFQSNERLGVVACVIRIHETGEVAKDSPEFSLDGNERDGYPCAAYNGTGVGIRASALKGVGYYPAYYFVCWVELHLCTKIRDRGWDVRCFPDIEVRHQKDPDGVLRPLTREALRGYYWYVWSVYPGIHAIEEAARYSGGLLKRVLRGEIALSLFVKATFDALVRLPSILRDRQPISVSTLRTLRRIRQNAHQWVDDAEGVAE
jgi:GT2 family glycosyltransferase